MAKFLAAAPVADIRGKVAGIVYSRNAAGMYIRQKVSPIQPRTLPQLTIRAAMTYASQYWRDTMTAAMRAAWEDYALHTPLSDQFGRRLPVSGIAMFLRFNVWWYTDCASLLTTAPTTPGEALMESATLTATVADGLRATAVEHAIGAGDRVNVQVCSAPTSQARNFFAGPWQSITAWGNATAFPQNIVATVAIGQRWWVRLRYFDNVGKVGPAWEKYVDCTA